MTSLEQIIDTSVKAIASPSVSTLDVQDRVTRFLSGENIIPPSAMDTVESAYASAARDLRSFIEHVLAADNGDKLNTTKVSDALNFLDDKIEDAEFKSEDREMDFPEVEGSIVCNSSIKPNTEYLPSISEVTQLVSYAVQNTPYNKSMIWNTLEALGLEDPYIQQFCDDVIVLYRKHGEKYFPEKPSSSSSIAVLKTMVVFRSEVEIANRNRDKAMAQKVNDLVREPSLIVGSEDLKPLEEDLFNPSPKPEKPEIETPTFTKISPPNATKDKKPILKYLLEIQKLTTEAIGVITSEE